MVKVGAVVLVAANGEKLPAGHPLRRLNKLVSLSNKISKSTDMSKNTIMNP